MNRKEFLTQLGSATVLACCGSVALQSCTSVRMVQGALRDNKVIIPLQEFNQQEFVVVRKSPGIPTPIYVAKISDTEFSALDMKCTHKGCELRPAGNLLSCPCHGSDFTNLGKVLSPPATRDLPTYTTTVDATNLYVHLQ